MNASKAAEALSTLYQTIAAAGVDGIPSGHLYAYTMNSFADVGGYEACIGMLVRTGLVKRENHVLTASVLG